MTRKAMIQGIFSAVMIALIASTVGASDIKFESPRSRTIVLGPHPLTISANLDPGVSITSVNFQVNGQDVGTRTEPPWSLEYDFGPDGQDTRIRAEAILSDGSVRRAYSRTRKFTVDQVSGVDLVNLYVLAQRPNGMYEGNLSQDDFQIFEDGVRQSIKAFSTEELPLTVVIALDVSHSMKKDDRLLQAQRSATSFLNELNADDQVILLKFSDDVSVMSELTPNLNKVKEQIELTNPERGTALYDGIYKGAKMLEDVPGRKVMILLTDGRDEAYSGLEPGSFHTLDEAIQKALKNEVMIFTIGLGEEVQHQKDFYDREFVVDILARIARSTGGRLLLPKRAGRLRQAFKAVETDLRNQYSIAYESTNTKQDGQWRSIEVKVKDDALNVITRDGYFAPNREPDKPAKRDFQTPANERVAPTEGSSE